MLEIGLLGEPVVVDVDFSQASSLPSSSPW